MNLRQKHHERIAFETAQEEGGACTKAVGYKA